MEDTSDKTVVSFTMIVAICRKIWGDHEEKVLYFHVHTSMISVVVKNINNLLKLILPLDYSAAFYVA